MTTNQLPPSFSEAPENSFNLSITTDPVNAGSTTGGGSYPSNTAVSISASPLPGYEFSTWQGSDIIDVNSSSTLVNLSQDLLLTAKFRKLSFNLLTNSTVEDQLKARGVMSMKLMQIYLQLLMKAIPSADGKGRN